MSEEQDMALASGIAAFEAKHFARAMQLLSPLTEQGDADAQYRVAIMCQNGLGVVRNEALAMKWMRAAARQGHALAQHGLGFMYLEGECVEKNGPEAAKWFQRAAEQGLIGSQTTLAMMYEEGKARRRALLLYKEHGVVHVVGVIHRHYQVLQLPRHPFVAAGILVEHHAGPRGACLTLAVLTFRGCFRHQPRLLQPALDPRAALGLEERQQVGIELVLVRVDQTMRCAWVDLQGRIRDEFR